jgi:hypothetical protein
MNTSERLGGVGLALPNGITPAGSGKAGQPSEVVWGILGQCVPQALLRLILFADLCASGVLGSAICADPAMPASGDLCEEAAELQ